MSTSTMGYAHHAKSIKITLFVNALVHNLSQCIHKEHWYVLMPLILGNIFHDDQDLLHKNLMHSIPQVVTRLSCLP